MRNIIVGVVALVLLFSSGAAFGAVCTTVPEIALAWELNPEPDVESYYVYRSDVLGAGELGPPILVGQTPTPAPNFVDTVPALGSYRYFLIAESWCVGEDGEKLISPMSEPSQLYTYGLELERPIWNDGG